MDQFEIKKDPTNAFRHEPTKEDAKYRRVQKASFAEKIEKLLPKNYPLLFHGTTIWNAKEILSSANISAEIDRKDKSEDVLDMSGKISVTTVESLWWTVKEFADLANFNYPAGCIFVLLAKDKEEFEMAVSTKSIQNVDFGAEPERLKNIITTPENVSRVKEWLSQSDIVVESDIVVDYDEFLSIAQKEHEKEHERTL